jgi:hypothetical protein
LARSPARRAGRAGIGSAAEPPHPAGDELVEPDGLAADHVERIAREPAGGPGDDGAKVGLLDQRVDVEALDDTIQIHPFEQAVQVDPVQHGVQIDQVQHRVHIQRGNHQFDRALRDGLGQYLPARDQPALRRAPPLKRVHEPSIAAPGNPDHTLRGDRQIKAAPRSATAPSADRRELLSCRPPRRGHRRCHAPRSAIYAPRTFADQAPHEVAWAQPVADRGADTARERATWAGGRDASGTKVVVVRGAIQATRPGM